MDLLGYKIIDFFKVLFSYIRAIARLFTWTFVFFFSGLQRTLFMRSEVASVEFYVAPLKCDVEEADKNIAYIDKLCLENPDLVEVAEEDDLDFLDDDDENEEEG